VYKIVRGNEVLESYQEYDMDVVAIWYWETEEDKCMYPYLFNNKVTAEYVAEYLNAEIEEV
jgi:hypothetical protein